MLLEVKNLKTEFKLKKGIVNAVDDVSFSIDKGKVLAIVGESGSGKSVTSLSIMGLMQEPGRITQGEILFKGKDLLKMDKNEMRAVRGDQISMIFQEPMTSLNPVYRVKDQIMESIMTHMKVSKKEAFERTVQVLETVGIPSARERANDYPHQMSGGMRQRVMIAMALIGNPELLIADEPTTALDVTIQAQILDLMLKLKDKLGTSILLITHDMGVVAEIAQNVVVMYCGKIVEKGSVHDIFEKPMHPYTVGLLQSIPRIDEKKEKLFIIPGVVPNPLNMPSGCAFRTRCSNCMEVCSKSEPPVVEIGKQQVRCFLYAEKKGGLE